jgi:hypothetical protein
MLLYIVLARPSHDPLPRLIVVCATYDLPLCCDLPEVFRPEQQGLEIYNWMGSYQERCRRREMVGIDFDLRSLKSVEHSAG